MCTQREDLRPELPAPRRCDRLDEPLPCLKDLGLLGTHGTMTCTPVVPASSRTGISERNGEGLAPLTKLLTASHPLPPLSLGPSLRTKVYHDSILPMNPSRLQILSPISQNTDRAYARENISRSLRIHDQTPASGKFVSLRDCMRGLPKEICEALPNDFHDGMVVMKRRRTRKYKNAKPSRFCHLCARKKPTRAVVCSNILSSTCLKVTCQACFKDPTMTFEDAMNVEAGWTCTHCRGLCPPRALCSSYDKANRKRNLENHIRKYEEDRRRQGTPSVHASPPCGRISVSRHLIHSL